MDPESFRAWRGSPAEVTPPTAPREVPDWIAAEVREAWHAATGAGGQLRAYRILESMVDRIGYGRGLDKPPRYLEG